MRSARQIRNGRKVELQKIAILHPEKAARIVGTNLQRSQTATKDGLQSLQLLSDIRAEDTGNNFRCQHGDGGNNFRRQFAFPIASIVSQKAVRGCTDRSGVVPIAVTVNVLLFGL
jgi:hypothetical protein